jgi:hypothetical protein
MAGPKSDDPALFLPSQGRGLEAIDHADCRRFAEYWRQRRPNGGGDRAMPARTDIDPVDLRWALSRLYLVDHDTAADCFRYRLAGDDIEAVFRHLTGRHSLRGVNVDDLLPPEGAAIVRKRWQPLLDHGHIVYMRGPVYLAADRIGLGARLLLPLSESQDGTVTGVLGFTDCQWHKADGPALRKRNRLEILYIPLAEVDSSSEHSGQAVGA